MRFVLINDKICAFNLYKTSAFVDFLLTACAETTDFLKIVISFQSKSPFALQKRFLHAYGLFGFLFECGAICFDNSFLKKLACFGVDGVNDVLIFSVGSLS